MDAQYFGMALDRLERLRETQIQQGSLLESVARNQVRTFEALTTLLNSKNGEAYTKLADLEKTKSPAPSPLFANPEFIAGFKWLAGILLILAAVLKGADVKEIAAFVSRVF